MRFSMLAVLFSVIMHSEILQFLQGATCMVWHNHQPCVRSCRKQARPGSCECNRNGQCNFKYVLIIECENGVCYAVITLMRSVKKGVNFLHIQVRMSACFDVFFYKRCDAVIIAFILVSQKS